MDSDPTAVPVRDVVPGASGPLPRPSPGVGLAFNLIFAAVALAVIGGAALLLAYVMVHSGQTSQQKCQSTYAKYGEDGGHLCDNGPQTIP